MLPLNLSCAHKLAHTVASCLRPPPRRALPHTSTHTHTSLDGRDAVPVAVKQKETVEKEVCHFATIHPTARPVDLARVDGITRDLTAKEYHQPGRQ